MLLTVLISCLLTHNGSPLISPMRELNGDADMSSIINHVTLLEQTVQDIPALKTQMAVLQSKLQASESEIARLTTDLNTCSINMAVVQSQVQDLKSAKDACEENVNNLTIAEGALQKQVNGLNNVVADVFSKSSSMSYVLNNLHGALDLVRIDDWVLVFRVQAGIGISAYDTWMNDAIYHDNPLIPWLVGPECQSLHTSQPCRVHFKSKIIPMWETANIQQVKVLLIKNSQVRQEILFDGVGTSKSSWFSRDHVINSTWTDLKTTPVNVFSIQGDAANPDRRFFISSEYHGCQGDITWLTIVDHVAGPCVWDNTSAIPQIIYSRYPTRSPTGTDDKHGSEHGDVMAVLVKLGEM